MSDDRRVLSGRSEFWIVVACVVVFCAGQLAFQRLEISVGSTVLYVCFLCLLGAPLFWVVRGNKDIGWLEYGIVSMGFVGMALIPPYSIPRWIDSLVFVVVVYACLQLAAVIRHFAPVRKKNSENRPAAEDEAGRTDGK
jgi:uncharacterized membrane protein YhaH (DUF805 family)